jgi:hypothetical protein
MICVRNYSKHTFISSWINNLRGRFWDRYFLMKWIRNLMKEKMTRLKDAEEKRLAEAKTL